MVRSVLLSLAPACVGAESLGLLQVGSATMSGTLADRVQGVMKMAASFKETATQISKGNTKDMPTALNLSIVRDLMQDVRQEAQRQHDEWENVFAEECDFQADLQDTRDDWISNTSSPVLGVGTRYVNKAGIYYDTDQHKELEASGHSHAMAGVDYHWDLFEQAKVVHCDARANESTALNEYVASINAATALRDRCIGAGSSPLNHPNTLASCTAGETPADANACFSAVSSWTTTCEALDGLIQTRNSKHNQHLAFKQAAAVYQTQAEAEFWAFADHFTTICNVYRQEYDAMVDRYNEKVENARTAQTHILNLVAAALKVDCYVDVIESAGAGLDYAGYSDHNRSIEDCGTMTTSNCLDEMIECLSENENGAILPDAQELSSCTFSSGCEPVTETDVDLFSVEYLQPYYIAVQQCAAWQPCDTTRIDTTPADGAATWAYDGVLHLSCSPLACSSDPLYAHLPNVTIGSIAAGA